VNILIKEVFYLLKERNDTFEMEDELIWRYFFMRWPTARKKQQEHKTIYW